MHITTIKQIYILKKMWGTDQCPHYLHPWLSLYLLPRESLIKWFSYRHILVNVIGAVSISTLYIISEHCGGNVSMESQDSKRHEESWSFDGKHWWFIWSNGRRIHKTGGVSRVDTAVTKPILKNSFCSSRF